MKVESISTPTLDIAYFERGPRTGRPVVLLHGFPDDPTSYESVAIALAERGFRTLAPFLRGFGDTRFRSAASPRAGDFAAFGQDVIDFIDALELRGAIVVGHDWGSPAAEIAAVFRPERVEKLVKLSWFGIYTTAEMARAPGFNFGQLQALWYVWMLNTPMGEIMLARDPVGFARTLWHLWSPSLDASSLNTVARSFDNPDFERVVLSAYRSNITEAEQDPLHAALREKLAAAPPVPCATVVVRGADDGVEKTSLQGPAIQRHFRGPFREVVLEGVGHFPQREAPAAVVSAVL